MSVTTRARALSLSRSLTVANHAFGIGYIYDANIGKRVKTLQVLLLGRGLCQQDAIVEEIHFALTLLLGFQDAKFFLTNKAPTRLQEIQLQFTNTCCQQPHATDTRPNRWPKHLARIQ
jgi:hypothetical protein